jgi:hypothetical protein
MRIITLAVKVEKRNQVGVASEDFKLFHSYFRMFYCASQRVQQLDLCNLLCTIVIFMSQRLDNTVIYQGRHSISVELNYKLENPKLDSNSQYINDGKLLQYCAY